jgi:hypothetical protein
MRSKGTSTIVRLSSVAEYSCLGFSLGQCKCLRRFRHSLMSAGSIHDPVTRTYLHIEPVPISCLENNTAAPKMKHDTQRTLQEIHGDVSSLRQALLDIERTHKEKRSEKDFPIQFLTRQRPPPGGFGSIIHLRLTTKAEYDAS